MINISAKVYCVTPVVFNLFSPPAPIKIALVRGTDLSLLKQPGFGF